MVCTKTWPSAVSRDSVSPPGPELRHRVVLREGSECQQRETKANQPVGELTKRETRAKSSSSRSSGLTR